MSAGVLRALAPFTHCLCALPPYPLPTVLAAVTAATPASILPCLPCLPCLSLPAWATIVMLLITDLYWHFSYLSRLSTPPPPLSVHVFIILALARLCDFRQLIETFFSLRIRNVLAAY